MKKLILLILLCFSFVEGGVASSPYNTWFYRHASIKPEKASFLIAYPKIRKWEGNYAWLKKDKGKETYAGISRKFQPKWSGWEALDKYKKDSSVYYNQKIEVMESYAIHYYVDVWVREDFYSLTNQRIANYLFDYRNTGQIMYVHLRKALKSIGYIFYEPIQSKLDKQTIAILNNISPDVLIPILKQIRKEYYYYCMVHHYKNDKTFLKGWFNRAEDDELI